MRKIVRSDINEDWVHSGIVEAGDFAFLNYCVGNVGQPVEDQINGAFRAAIEIHRFDFRISR